MNTPFHTNNSNLPGLDISNMPSRRHATVKRPTKLDTLMSDEEDPNVKKNRHFKNRKESLEFVTKTMKNIKYEQRPNEDFYYKAGEEDDQMKNYWNHIYSGIMRGSPRFQEVVDKLHKESIVFRIQNEEK